jgi:hypothetical protein
VDRQAILGGSAPGESYLWDPAPFVGENMEDPLRGTETRASHTGSYNHVRAGEPRVILTIEKHKVSLLTDTGASISAIPFSPGPRSSKKITVWGISGQPLECYFTQYLACSWGDFHFSHSFLIVSETPTPLLGRDLLSKLGVQLLLPPGE